MLFFYNITHIYKLRHKNKNLLTIIILLYFFIFIIIKQIHLHNSSKYNKTKK